jgi:hypothetical protein
MRYIIYDNIDEKDFEEIKNRLDSIEKISSPLMQLSGFYLNRKQYDDVLSLDYVHEDKEFMGNLGVAYDEEGSDPEKRVFNFYILKAYDENGRRFYKKTSLGVLYTLPEIEEKFVSLFEQCVLLYNSIEKKEMIDSIVLQKL